MVRVNVYLRLNINGSQWIIYNHYYIYESHLATKWLKENFEKIKRAKFNLDRVCYLRDINEYTVEFSLNTII